MHYACPGESKHILIILVRRRIPYAREIVKHCGLSIVVSAGIFAVVPGDGHRAVSKKRGISHAVRFEFNAVVRLTSVFYRIFVNNNGAVAVKPEAVAVCRPDAHVFVLLDNGLGRGSVNVDNGSTLIALVSDVEFSVNYGKYIIVCITDREKKLAAVPSGLIAVRFILIGNLFGIGIDEHVIGRIRVVNPPACIVAHERGNLTDNVVTFLDKGMELVLVVYENVAVCSDGIYAVFYADESHFIGSELISAVISRIAAFLHKTAEAVEDNGFVPPAVKVRKRTLFSVALGFFIGFSGKVKHCCAAFAVIEHCGCTKHIVSFGRAVHGSGAEAVKINLVGAAA